MGERAAARGRAVTGRGRTTLTQAPVPAILNEMYADDGSVRPHYAPYARWLEATPTDRIAEKRAEADALFHRAGIPFAVAGEDVALPRARETAVAVKRGEEQPHAPLLRGHRDCSER